MEQLQTIPNKEHGPLSELLKTLEPSQQATIAILTIFEGQPQKKREELLRILWVVYMEKNETFSLRQQKKSQE